MSAATRNRDTRLLLAAGLAVFAFLTFTQDSNAAFALSKTGSAEASDSTVTTSSVLRCRSAGGPCYFINVVVYGNGVVTSTSADNGMHVRCPPLNGFNCTTDPWFNWTEFEDPAMIEFTATVGLEGWGDPDTSENGCLPDTDERVHQPTTLKCRFWLEDMNGMEGLCLEAHFGPSPVVGPPDLCAHYPTAPIGSPVNVTKTGPGQAGGTVTSVPAGINCGTGPACSSSFLTGTNPSLHVTMNSTTTFLGWTAGPCSGTNTTCTWVMAPETGYNITANFGTTGPPPPPVKLNTVLQSKPAKLTRSRTASFYWRAKRGTVYVSSFKSQCKLGRGSWLSCKPGKTYRRLKPGYHTVRIRVGDSAGWDATPASWTWKIRK